MDYKVITSGLRFPEGPIALADGSVLVVEIGGGRLTKVLPDGTKQTVAELGGGPNGAAMGPDGKIYVCNNGGLAFIEHNGGLRPNGYPPDYSGGRIERVDLVTGKVEILYDHSENGPLHGPNDIVFDKHGGFYFTDAGKVRHRDLDRASVYYALPDGSSIKEVVFPLIQANGVGLSRDEDILYVSETMGGRLWRFEIDGPGEVRKLPFPSPNGGTLLIGMPGYQLFDSMAIDAEGNICVATILEQEGITVFSPQGEILRRLSIPDRYISNICFGGKDLKTAFVTLAQTGKLISFPWEAGGQPLNFLNK
jgi:gluconolactonase